MEGNELMTFGKYSGQPIKDVPAGYFQYLYDKGIINVHNWNKVFNYAKDNGLINLEVKAYKKGG